MRNMFQFSNLRGRILFYFLTISVVALLVAFGIVYYQVSRDIRLQETEKLIAVRNLKANRLLSWLEERKGDIRVVANDNQIRAMEILFFEVEIPAVQREEIFTFARSHLQSYLKNFPDYQELLIVHPETGRIVLSTLEEREGVDVSARPYFHILNQPEQVLVHQIRYSEYLRRNTLDFSVPIYCAEHQGEHIVGVLVARTNPEVSLYPLLGDTAGLGESGETMIVNREGIVQNPLRWHEEAALYLKIDSPYVLRASQGLAGVMESTDYRGEQVLAAYTFLPELGWDFIVKQDTREVFLPLNMMIYQFILLFGVIAVLVFFVARGIATAVTKPLEDMSEVSLKIQNGDYSQRVKEVGQKEISHLAKTINRTTQTIERAINISKARTGILEQIIKTRSIKQFTWEIIRQLCHYSDSQVCAIYGFNQNTNKFEHLDSIGMDKKLIESFDFNSKEGIVGDVVNKKGIIYLKDISPETVFSYKTVTGNMVPREMIAFPLIHDGKIKAVIILASIYPYHAEVLEMISQSMTQIAITMENLLADEEAKHLHQEIKERNESLKNLTSELKEQAEELKNQKEELEHQNIELELQKNEVQEANRLKGEFLSNMSHELRTPLNSIIALSDILETQLKKDISEEQSQYLKVIARNGKNLLNLINDILDLSKIEAGKINILPEYFSLKQVIHNICDDFSYQSQEKGIGLKIELSEELPEIYTDRQKVNQILQNLVSNAVKFTERGSVKIKCDYNDKRKIFTISVLDTGIGIAGENIDSIFEEFKQVDGSVSRKYGGTGLGLSIVSRLVKKLGGEIFVESKEGEGSVFTVNLPREIARDYNIALLAKDKEKAPEKEEKTKTKSIQSQLLLVEDNESAISQVKFLLEDKGHRVAVARKGQEALQHLQKQIPDGIILDLMMPEMDGFEVLKALRQSASTKDIPVLILTAKDLTEEEISELKSNGIQKILFKGAIDREELLEKINKLLPDKATQKVEEHIGEAPGRDFTIQEIDSNIMDIPVEKYRGKKILVAEDNGDNLLTIKAILKEYYQVIEAIDGEEALRKIYHELPDLILLDIGLPEIDGFEIIRRLKKDSKTKNIPVIALTARAMSEEREKILQEGSDDYLAKPVETSGLLKKINKWISKE